MSDIKDAAQALECSLMILRKDKDGWVFGFRVHPNDAPRSLLDASLGTRFQMVFFEINDDETYVIPEETRKGKLAVSIAGEMCREPMFQRWLAERMGLNWVVETRDDADGVEGSTADRLRDHLGIDSRADLLDNEPARDSFRDLIKEYRHETRDGR